MIYDNYFTIQSSKNHKTRIRWMIFELPRAKTLTSFFMQMAKARQRVQERPCSGTQLRSTKRSWKENLTLSNRIFVLSLQEIRAGTTCSHFTFLQDIDNTFSVLSV